MKKYIKIGHFFRITSFETYSSQPMAVTNSKFKDKLVVLCNNLKVENHTLSPQDHDGILCQQFHRYLNKVQQLGAADQQMFQQFALYAVFATYAWNTSPIVGTNTQNEPLQLRHECSNFH